MRGSHVVHMSKEGESGKDEDVAFALANLGKACQDCTCAPATSTSKGNGSSRLSYNFFISPYLCLLTEIIDAAMLGVGALDMKTHDAEAAPKPRT